MLQSISGSFSGGQRITVSGTGLYEDVSVTVCDKACSVSNSPDTTSLVCDTPAHSGEFAMTSKIGYLYVVIPTFYLLLESL